MKGELVGKTMTELTALKPITYSYLTNDNTGVSLQTSVLY